MIERHLAKLRARDRIDAEEEEAIRSAVSEIRDLPADKTFINAGETLNHSTLLLDGWMCRYKDLKSGKRQVTEVHVAGDFADLHSFTLRRLDHNIMTLTPCRIAVVPHDRLRRITEDFPRLTRIYWFSTNLDAAIHREWEVSLGRRSAIARLANLLCELHVRLGLVGLVDGMSYGLPLTQTDLAECMGLTNVHVNRTVRELREMQVAEVQSGKVTIRDWATLAFLAEFDQAYLYLDRLAI